MQEKALIRACQKGQKQAFDELIRSFYPYVFHFLLKTTCDKPLSEDLTQETFLKVIRSIEQFHVNGSVQFGTWIIAIAKNCYIDHLRRNHVFLEPIDHLALPDTNDVVENVLQKMQYEEVVQAIASLPPEQGLAIRMKYEENLTLAEIALHFGVQPKTIKSRIHDGTVKLRQLLNVKGRNTHNE